MYNTIITLIYTNLTARLIVGTYSTNKMGLIAEAHLVNKFPALEKLKCNAVVDWGGTNFFCNSLIVASWHLIVASLRFNIWCFSENAETAAKSFFQHTLYDKHNNVWCTLMSNSPPHVIWSF